MAMPDAFKATLVLAFSENVDELSLHTASPGTTGANESAVDRVPLTWSAPVDGVTTALAEISDLTGEYNHVGLWGNGEFRQGIPCNISYVAPADVAILVTHEVGEDVSLV